MCGGLGDVADVLDGIERRRRAGLAPIKINCVVQRGVNDHTCSDLVEHFRGTGASCASSNTWMSARAMTGIAALVVPSRELRDRIHARWPIAPRRRRTTAAKSPSATRSTTARGEVGFISSVTQPFCGDCIARAVSSDGSFYTCLFARRARTCGRRCAPAPADDELIALIRASGRCAADRYSEMRDARNAASRKHVEMYLIGG